MGRDLGQRTPIGTLESERVVRGARDAVALFMDRAVMAPAEEDEVRQRGWTALSPVAYVMPLADPHLAAREPAGPVPMEQCRRNAGGMTRVRAPISSSRPSRSCRITTRLASHAKRRDVSAETWPISSSVDWPVCSASASTAASTWTTTWYRSPGAPGSRP